MERRIAALKADIRESNEEFLLEEQQARFALRVAMKLEQESDNIKAKLSDLHLQFRSQL